jgi:hypothetical protein
MLVIIARDYLIISAVSVGVKRLFNITKDIYFYRRHHLKPAIIRALVITMCINRFLLLKELDDIKATKEAEEVRLFKEPEDQKIFEIKDLKSLINDKENSNEDFNFNNNKMAHRAINEDDKKNKRTIKIKSLKTLLFPYYDVRSLVRRVFKTYTHEIVRCLTDY